MDFYTYHGAPKALYVRKNNAQAILSSIQQLILHNTAFS